MTSHHEHKTRLEMCPKLIEIDISLNIITVVLKIFSLTINKVSERLAFQDMMQSRRLAWYLQKAAHCVLGFNKFLKRISPNGNINRGYRP